MKDVRGDVSDVWERLAKDEGGRIVYLILDGLGGLPQPGDGRTELEAARTPHLDELAAESSCGLLELVGPGITPGSGPGHLALFGYDPLRYQVGRGILSALGIDFELQPGDVAARVNFATVDAKGRVTDRRAGRLPTHENERLSERLRNTVRLDFDGRYFLETVSEHRAVLVLRGSGLSGAVEATDPQRTGVPPREPNPRARDARLTSRLIRSFAEQAGAVLAEEKTANMVLLRGFDQYHTVPSLYQRFGLEGLCLADYPMYRGVSRLLGLEVYPPPGGVRARFEELRRTYGRRHTFYFLHVKQTDSRGEDADFGGKVRALEAADGLVPLIREVEPDVLVVTGDHSTPAAMGAHSWHPVPALLHAKTARRDRVARFEERSCGRGSLGLRPAFHLMGLALGHAGRLEKFGA